MSKNKKRIIGIVLFVTIIALFRLVLFPPSDSKDGSDCEQLALPNSGPDPQAAAIRYLEDKKPADFNYMFETFTGNGVRTYMEVTMRNDEACFKAKLLVEKWDKLEGMRKVNGQSYPKELHGLKWHLEPRHDGMQIVYDDMATIID